VSNEDGLAAKSSCLASPGLTGIASRATCRPVTFPNKSASESAREGVGASANPESRILDPDQMRNLRKESPTLLWRLIPLFHSHAEKTFSSMEAAAKTGYGKVLSEGAHTLKGSAVNFGAERFVAACQQLEDAGNEGRAQGYGKLLDAVRVEYEYLTQALKTF